MQGLPFETTTQFVALGLTLLAGWLLGLATRSGRSKWRERYQDEELAHGAYRKSTEVELRDKDRRIRELETEITRLKGAGTVAVPAAAVAAGTAHGMAHDERPGWGGWFGWGRDNLSRIRGIDEVRERRLNELGVKTYREIEKMSPSDEAALEERLGLRRGTIGEEGWREQAAMLRAGNEDEHGRRFS